MKEICNFFTECQLPMDSRKYFAFATHYSVEIIYIHFILWKILLHYTDRILSAEYLSTDSLLILMYKFFELHCANGE